MVALLKLPLMDAIEPVSLGGGPFRVGELAKLTGKTVRALHLYEELGLLSPSERSAGGYRLYGDEAVLRVRWIGKLQDMGFSLTEITEIVQEWARSHSAPSAMQRVGELYREKLVHTRTQIARLQALARELQDSLGYIDTCEACNPQREISACSCCDLHDCHSKTPELVAGLQVNPHALALAQPLTDAGGVSNSADGAGE